jgi:hypothetical protein
MPMRCAAANLLWAGSSLQAWGRYRSALRDPAVAQEQILSAYLAENSETAIGRAHGFSAIRSVEEYQTRVPLTTYDDLEPLIERIASGHAGVLTGSPVTRLVPSSGSASAAKLIPYTPSLQREFSRAIGAWIVDLYLHRPRLLGGTAYWSISPAMPSSTRRDSIEAVPIGFDDDSAYLGGSRQALVRAVLAVPAGVRSITDLDAFRHTTLLFLLRARELRIISVWHPSFLTQLLDALEARWDRLIADLARCDARRAAELRPLRSDDVQRIWPKLALISCWGDGPARSAAESLARRFPHVELQPKGLIATEAIVTIPFGGRHPLAIGSHFFEFLDPHGRARLAHQLERGVDYTVVVTTAGGLYRYRLADRVTVDGWCEATPSLCFLGKEDSVSDLFGEKLSDAFVAKVLASLLEDGRPPAFAMLAPHRTASGTSYTLFIEGDRPGPPDLAAMLERELRRNPHYAWCVDLGQLRPAGVMRVGPGAHEAYLDLCVAKGRRLGDIKPVSLDPDLGWAAALPR